MKRFLRPTAYLLILALGGSMALSSCRLIKGDPRKNCNHPKHGEYMKEQRTKNMKR